MLRYQSGQLGQTVNLLLHGYIGSNPILSTMKPHYAALTRTLVTKAQIFSDPLATDRTILANERTFLAYIRTSMTIAIAAVSLIKFIGDTPSIILGWIMLTIAACMTIIGFSRWWNLRSVLEKS